MVIIFIKSQIIIILGAIMTEKINQTVLIVDDQEINRAILGKILESKYNIIEASNFKQNLSYRWYQY
jgi:response regulator RpfG family c-di-GMP phosphodiesterase